MLNLTLFEMKKFLHKKKNLIIIAFFIIIMAVWVGLNASIENQLKSSEIPSIEDRMESIKNALKGIDNEIEKLPNNMDLVNIKKDYNEEIQVLTKEKIAYTNNDFSTYLNCKLKLDKKLLSQIQSGKVISGKNIEELRNDIEINSILLQKHIEPIYENTSMKAYNFMKLALGSHLPLIIVILIIMLSADIISKEFECNTYKLLFTQPINKNSILFSKIISLILMINIIIFSILGIFFLILGVKNGFGSPNYPTKFLLNGTIQYIDVAQYIGTELLLLLMISIFTCIFSTFVSMLCKNTGTSISISIIITVGLYTLVNKGLFNSIAHLIPVTYIDISEILLGSRALAFKNSSITTYNSFIILFIATILVVVLSAIKFDKRLTPKK